MKQEHETQTETERRVEALLEHAEMAAIVGADIDLARRVLAQTEERIGRRITADEFAAARALTIAELAGRGPRTEPKVATRVSLLRGWLCAELFHLSPAAETDRGRFVSHVAVITHREERLRGRAGSHVSIIPATASGSLIGGEAVLLERGAEVLATNAREALEFAGYEVVIPAEERRAAALGAGKAVA